MANQETIIELQGLSKRYGFGDAEYYALRDFDLTVKRGEFIMIMGPSGCGKTTLLNIIGLIDKPSSGQFLLGDRDVSRISSRRQAKFRARQIG
ncbi:ATP-binding cassette domain-containing protein, partial [Candidatus Saccharibacteria bacterium]|nr:ATP-binding cassette domain-containing protein [Candidatus Saccharibacteria bacterium]